MLPPHAVAVVEIKGRVSGRTATVGGGANDLGKGGEGLNPGKGLKFSSFDEPLFRWFLAELNENSCGVSV